MHAGQGSQHGRWIYVGEGKSALETEVGPPQSPYTFPGLTPVPPRPRRRRPLRLVTLRKREPDLPAGAPRPAPLRGGRPGARMAAEARGPSCPRRGWSLWTVGRWPAFPVRFPGGGRPQEPPFAGVSAAGTLHPRAVCLSPSRPPSRGCPGSAADRFLGDSVGAIGWPVGVVAVRRGAVPVGCSLTPTSCVPNSAPPPRGGGLPPLWHVPALWVAGGPGEVQVRYLVDSASSHMLVSKIKPCMSKYKQSIR